MHGELTCHRNIYQLEFDGIKAQFVSQLHRVGDFTKELIRNKGIENRRQHYNVKHNVFEYKGKRTADYERDDYTY